jgi:hypothetical protein
MGENLREIEEQEGLSPEVTRRVHAKLDQLDYRIEYAQALGVLRVIFVIAAFLFGFALGRL